MAPNSGLGVEIGKKCFTFQLNHPILGLYLAPASADQHALGILGSSLCPSTDQLCDLGGVTDLLFT